MAKKNKNKKESQSTAEMERPNHYARFVAAHTSTGVHWHLSMTQLTVLRDEAYKGKRLDGKKEQCQLENLHTKGVLNISANGPLELTDVGQHIVSMLQLSGFFDTVPDADETDGGFHEAPSYLGQESHYTRFRRAATKKGFDLTLTNKELSALDREAYKRSGIYLSRGTQCACRKLTDKGFLELDETGQAGLTDLGNHLIKILVLTKYIQR